MSRLAAAVGAVVAAATLGTVTPAAATLGPSVQLGLPGGTAAHGLFQFTVSGHVDPTQRDRPAEFALFVDGRRDWVGSLVCADKDVDPDPTVCTVHGTWDSSGSNGVYVLQAQFRTDDDRAAMSAPVSVTADNPDPAVQLAPPFDGATVHGLTSVTVTAALDPGQTDRPTGLQLLINGQLFDSAQGDCTKDSNPDPFICTTTFSWDTTLATGSYVLQGQLHTAHY